MPEKAVNNDIELLEHLTEAQTNIKNELSKVIVGQEEVIDNLQDSPFVKMVDLVVKNAIK